MLNNIYPKQTCLGLNKIFCTKRTRGLYKRILNLGASLVQTNLKDKKRKGP